ncbi:MAG TPA: hypothetical protein VLE46_07005 [Nitrospira sp.]|nr:hypothetical protein [Nitrospira sp.]
MVHRFRHILLAAVLSGLFVEMTWAEERPAPKSLWQAVTIFPPTSQPSMPRRAGILREREIVLDLPLLQMLKDAGARPLPRITVELFDHANPVLNVTSTLSRINDTAVIRGTFMPPDQGDFTFMVAGNVLIATIRIGDRLFKTEHIANGRLLLVEINPDEKALDP